MLQPLTNYLVKPVVRPLFPFNPTLLFTQGEQGVFYDPSDLTTLYQDAAGTIPVTAAGQPVGLMMDKSGNGNHAYQTTSAARPLLGRVPVTGRRNLATNTQNSAGRLNARVANVEFDEIGLQGNASRFTANPTDTQYTASGIVAWEAGVPQTASIYVRMLNGQAPVFNSTSPTFASNQFAIIFADGGNPYDAIPQVELIDLVNGIYRVTVTKTPVVDGSARVGVYRYTSNIYLGTEFDILAFQFETGTEPTAHQKVVSDLDVTEAGVRDAWYLQGDGVDDGLISPSIQFSADWFASAAFVVGGQDQNIMDADNSVVRQAQILRTVGSNLAVIGFDQSGAANVMQSTQNILSTKIVGSSSMNAGNLKLFLDSSEVDQTTVINPAAKNIGVSLFYKAGGAPQRMSGKIFGAVLLASRTATNTERQKTEQWLAGKAGVTL